MVEEEYRESIVEEIPWFFRRKAFKTMKDDIFLWIGQTQVPCDSSSSFSQRVVSCRMCLQMCIV